MRVVHWYPNFLGGGGIANSVFGLAEEQATLGADVIIAAAEHEAAPLYGEMDTKRARVLTWRPVWTIDSAGFYVRGISKQDRSRFRSLAPDIVHIHGEFNADNFWTRLLFACPLVLTVHGAFHPIVLSKSRQRRKMLYVNVARRLLYNRVTFHALSPLDAEQIEAVVPRASVYCLPQGPGPLVKAWPGHARTGERVSVDFITIARLEVFTKGLDLLLEAYSRASRACATPMTLTVVGPDWAEGRETLERQARELRIDEQVHFTGPVAAARVGHLLSAASVYVQSSRREGLSLSVTEALVAGKPVILTNATGTSSYDEVASLAHIQVVTPDAAEIAEAMIRCVDNIDDLTALGQQARHSLSEFFSWRRLAEGHLNQYCALLRR